MGNIVITPLTKKIIVRFSDSNVSIPQNVQNKIDAYWNDLVKSGKNYKRGEVFTVTEKKETKDSLEVLVEKTDYAHYLYCQNVDDLGEQGVHIIHTAVLVETIDGKFIFGKMGNQTSRAGIYQLCGGGIDDKDLRKDVFDLDHNIKKELEEELGIDVEDRDRIGAFELAFFKEGGPTNKMSVIYQIKLNETIEEFLKEYDKFILKLQENGEQPEFGEIVVLDNSDKGITDFLSKNILNLDEYMRPLFEYIIHHR